MKISEKFTLTCATKPSLFAYPTALEEKKEEKAERVQTAVLSTTAKAKAKARLKAVSEGKPMEEEDVEMKEAEVAVAAEEGGEETKKDKEEDEKKEKEEKKKMEEPESFELSNPCRVTYVSVLLIVFFG